MRKLLGTLFINSEDIYLALENENVVAYQDNKIVRRIPLLGLQSIISFSYKGASPALMGACAERNIAICFLTPRGRFLARACGLSYGNVLLRKQQYRISDDIVQSCLIARNFICGKLYNAHSVVNRILRDHKLSVDEDTLILTSSELMRKLRLARKCSDLEELRGIEGNAAKDYFAVFPELILRNKGYFAFEGRVKRPPTDAVNALLSFAYVLLAHDCASALESVGLDAYVGFLHRDRPGRTSLALDLMEEFRHVIADRCVLYVINNQMLNEKHFDKKPDGAVYLNDNGRKIFLSEWDKRRKEEIIHPFLEEKMPWGMLPYSQALLLARYVRGDLEEYPAFLWK